MRVPLVGPSYSLAEVAAAAQVSLNVYPEFIEDGSGGGKGRGIMRGCPGAHAFADTAGRSIRCLWSGGGRLFVVTGTGGGSWLTEYRQNGTIVTDRKFDDSSDDRPAQAFGNGQQLGIVANGFFYLDNGAGPIKARFQLNGTVAIAGTAVTWVAGDKFPTYAPTTGDPLPGAIYINGVPVGVTFTSATTATLAVALAGGAGTVTRNGSVIFWSGGTVFDPSWVGMPIVISGVTYTIATIASPYAGTIVETPAGIEYGAAYTVTVGNNTYSTAGGDPVTAVTGAYLGSTFFVQRPSGGSPDLGRQVNFSAVNDGTNWSGLDFFSKESGPDYLQAIYADHAELYLFGTGDGEQATSEVWALDQNTGRPTRLQGAESKLALTYRFSVCSMDESVFFVGGAPRGSPVAYRMNGFTPVRISTHAVEQSWAASSQQADFVLAYTYTDQGHQFWVVAMADVCWVYDATASKDFGYPIWHLREAAVWPTPGHYRWAFHVFIPEWGVGGKHIVAESVLTTIAELSSNFADEFGFPIPFIKDLPYRWNGAKLIFFGRMDLEMQTGSAWPAPGPPVVTRSYSDDRGQTFANPQDASIGAPGAFSARVAWPCGGSSRGRVWRFQGYLQNPFALIDLNSEDVDGIV